MATMAIFIIDDTVRQAAIALNDTDAALDPQLITNELANNVGSGLGIGNIVGLYMLPARLLNDSAFSRWDTMFASTPIYTVDTDVLFTPLNI